MKRIDAWSIPCLLILTMFLGAQVPQRYVIDIHSTNDRYVLHIEGKYYEGYVGPQEMTLRTDETILWKKKTEIFTTPVVSNLGDVAIIGKDDGLYDTTGKRLGVLTPSDTVKNFYAPPPDGSPIHRYSNDGRWYYTFLNSGNDSLAFVATDRTGKERWRVTIEKTPETPPTDIVSFDGGVIIHNYSWAAQNLTNVCYLINDGGRVLSHYSTSLYNILPPSLDDARKALHVTDNKKLSDQKIIGMYRGYIIRTLPPTIDVDKKEFLLPDTTNINIYDLHSGKLKKSMPISDYLKLSKRD